MIVHITQDESTIWEHEHFNNIIGWKSEWDVKDGYKVVTFTMKNKTEVTHEIKTN